jgi:PAS domain S-box-containing protein
MKLREKIFLVIVVVLVLITSALLLLSSAIMLRNYEELEVLHATENARKAVHAVDTDVYSLNQLVRDWAPRDDTYAFVNGRKPDYVAANLPPDTYRDRKIHVLIITDTSGRITYAGSYDPDTWAPVAVPAALLEQLVPGGPFLSNLSPYASTAGIVALPDGPMIVASQPILHTDYTGPAAGMFLMGKYLDEEEVARLSDRPVLDYGIFPINSSSAPREMREAAAPGTGPVRIFTEPLNESVLAAYAPLTDIYGIPVYVLRLEMSRDVHAQGVSTVFTYILIQLGVGLFFGLLVIVLIDRFVLSRLEQPIRTMNGIERSGDLSKRIAVTGDDELSGLMLSMNRMLDRIEGVQQNLQKSETRFRELAELLPEMVFELDTAGRVTFANRRGLEKTGYTAEDVARGLDGLSIIVPEDRDRGRAQLARLSAGPGVAGSTYTAARKDGATFPVIIYTTPIIQDGSVRGFRGIVVDISDRVEAERKIQESAQYLQTLFNAVRAGIIAIDARTHQIIDVNPAAAAAIGLPRKSIVGQEWYRFATDLNLTADNAEGVLLRADGRSIPIIEHAVSVFLNGKPCYLKTFIDDTQRKQAEEALRVSEARFRELAELFPQFIFEMNQDFLFTFFNWSAVEITAYSYDDFAGGLNALSLANPSDSARVRGSFGRILRGEEVPPIQFTLLRKDGTPLPVLMYASPIVRDNEYSGIRGIIVDIAEQKRLETALTTANRKLNLMNSVTRHDILNSITGLLGLVDMMGEMSSDVKALSLIMDARDLVIKIKKQILFTKDYQDVGVKAPQWQSLHSGILNAASAIGLKHARLTLPENDAEVFADPLFGRVFYNLIDNSLRHGGSVREISVDAETAPDGSLIIRYRDDGTGVPTEDKERIFEQGVGKNTGFGLFIIREILGITGSTIRETGAYGHGALFEIRVPEGAFRPAPGEREL